MSDNAEVSGNTKGQVSGIGPNKLGTTAAPLADMIERSNGTQGTPIDGGTLESNGPNTMGAA